MRDLTRFRAFVFLLRLRLLPLLALLPAWHSPVVRSAELEFSFVPQTTGTQLFRASLPFPRGFSTNTTQLEWEIDGRSYPVAIRSLAAHPNSSEIRRALVSSIITTSNRATRRVTLRTPGPNQATPAPLPVQRPRLMLDSDGLRLHGLAPQPLAIRLIRPGPALSPSNLPPVQTVESNAFFLWRRWAFNDSAWPALLESREDALGTVALTLHVQRRDGTDGFAPDLGIELSLPAGLPVTNHTFTGGIGASLHHRSLGVRLDLPTAHRKRRGYLEIQAPTADAPGTQTVLYRRCSSDEQVPFQSYAWERVDLVLAPAGQPPLTATLDHPASVTLDPALWAGAYGTLAWRTEWDRPELVALRDYHHRMIKQSLLEGDDFGNITAFQEGNSTASVHGMNRLNLGLPIFEEFWRFGDHQLREAALLWCINMRDRSIWWGPHQTGGTRYNNVAGMDRTPPTPGYMWRSTNSVHFCTKGFECFQVAYEETGDPAFAEALDAQLAYAIQHIHADRGEARNIGDVRDFIRLYEWTGRRELLEHATRLFTELRTKLSTGNLFSQSGHPLQESLPFIDDDQVGYKNPFAKPYILGYALAGLPLLARHNPDLPQLKEVIEAVAAFMATSMDPLGGWRYPAPHSSALLLNQALEHAWQLVQASRHLGPSPSRLDAIETMLRQRVQSWLVAGQSLSGLSGWEETTGRITNRAAIYSLYKTPADRDPTRDYSHGRFGLGNHPPEAVVYFTEVLAYYLQHRPFEALLKPAEPGSPLGQVLNRMRATARLSSPTHLTTNAVADGLPTFLSRVTEAMTFPDAWANRRTISFPDWNRTGRTLITNHWLKPPPAAPNRSPVLLSEQDRGSYTARKLLLSLHTLERSEVWITRPKGPGPFPAVLLLHDHGARFDIGKEKMIRPWDVPETVLQSATNWVGTYYGGRFLGDELAARGYLCLTMDALNWSSRGGAGYEGQQALGANLLQLGMSHAGLMAWEDLECVKYLASLPEVDPDRIAAMGLSMGGFRTWQVAAASPRIRAGVSIGWLGTVKGLITPGNNQTRGQSSFTMTHPGLFNHLDYPDIASLAAPRAMLFYNGTRDPLFPVPVVQAAYDTLRQVWESQGASHQLETRFWDEPHRFTAAMQEESFAWLDRAMADQPTSTLPQATSVPAGKRFPLPRPRRVLYNLDGDSCMTTRAGSKGPVAIQLEDLKQLVQEVAYPASQVDTLLVCINAQVTYYPSRVGTQRGTLSTPAEREKWSPGERQRYETMERFFSQGIDPYAVLLAEMRRRGREALLTFRMNDDHGNDFLRTRFWADHPEHRLGSGALNFANAPVRDYVSSLIEEALDRYDADGIELDFQRFPRFFKTEAGPAELEAMTRLVQRIRQHLDQLSRARGRRLVLAIRAPSDFGRARPSLQRAQALGCDIKTWADRGWIDFLTVSEFLYHRFDLDVKPWKSALPGLPIYGGIECTEGGKKEQYLSAEGYRRAATLHHANGADGTYLFNFFTTREYGAEAWDPPFDVLKSLWPPPAVQPR